MKRKVKVLKTIDFLQKGTVLVVNAVGTGYFDPNLPYEQRVVLGKDVIELNPEYFGRA